MSATVDVNGKRGKKNRKNRKRKFKDDAVEGFTLIGEVESKSTKRVERVLPDWLSNPSLITVNLKVEEIKISEIPNLALSNSILQVLQQSGISYLFPVQYEVIPWLLSPINSGTYHHPRDLCVSAPTGSGKTLTYVLPIVQRLMERIVCSVRALVVLPVRDLAIQVYKVFSTYAVNTPLKVGLLVGQKNFSIEQSGLVKLTNRGFVSQFDILVATPGKLVDHIKLTKGFCLHRLQFLVIDEADRMMEEINQDWLSCVEDKVYSSDISYCHLCDGSRKAPAALTVSALHCNSLYLQKLLFSATLSQSPEKLQKLGLFQPKLFTSVSSASNNLDTDERKIVEKHGDFVGKFTTPVELKEYFVKCDVSVKPMMLYHLLKHFNVPRTVCFTNSVESTHRLNLLVSSMGDINVAEISSGLRSERRERIIKQFTSGKLDLIICSDVMARGMDFEKVDYIISYDLPPYLKTYIHRIGRTARAGRQGNSIILLQKKEIKRFQKMIVDAGKEPVPQWKIDLVELKCYEERYRNALAETAKVIDSKKKSAR